MKRVLSITVLAVLLAACGEKPQALGAVNRDQAAYTGTGKAFVASGWKEGDRSSWESQMKARMQRGQNDYERMN
jgi:major membrane immunogen (membrane-anchored lipoprotein)